MAVRGMSASAMAMSGREPPSSCTNPECLEASDGCLLTIEGSSVRVAARAVVRWGPKLMSRKLQGFANGVVYQTERVSDASCELDAVCFVSAGLCSWVFLEKHVIQFVYPDKKDSDIAACCECEPVLIVA